MPEMGQFRVRGRLRGPTGTTEDVNLLVDTRATFLVVPQSVADRLQLRVRGRVVVQTAGGAEVTRPIADLWVTVDDRETPTPCLIVPEGEPILGAVALESLFFAADPVRRQLVPTKGYVLTAA